MGNATRHFSAKDQNAYTKLKYRQIGQSSKEEVAKKNLRSELEEREATQLISKKESLLMIKKEEQKVDVIKLLTNVPDASSTSNKVYNDADADAGVNLKGPVSDDDLDSSR